MHSGLKRLKSLIEEKGKIKHAHRLIHNGRRFFYVYQQLFHCIETLAVDMRSVLPRDDLSVPDQDETMDSRHEGLMIRILSV